VDAQGVGELLLADIPGEAKSPQVLLGRQLEEVFPVAFLPQNHTLAPHYDYDVTGEEVPVNGDGAGRQLPRIEDD
jgi:hypothetical protein